MRADTLCSLKGLPFCLVLDTQLDQLVPQINGCLANLKHSPRRQAVRYLTNRQLLPLSSIQELALVKEWLDSAKLALGAMELELEQQSQADQRVYKKVRGRAIRERERERARQPCCLLQKYKQHKKDVKEAENAFEVRGRRSQMSFVLTCAICSGHNRIKIAANCWRIARVILVSFALVEFCGVLFFLCFFFPSRAGAVPDLESEPGLIAYGTGLEDESKRSLGRSLEIVIGAREIGKETAQKVEVATEKLAGGSDI